MDFVTYNEIRQCRDHQLNNVSRNHIKLNQLHEQILKQVLNLSIKKVTEQHGSPPLPFSFFVMGSAGRLEQSVWSDQDHGIIYRGETNEARTYFLTLGKEISMGLTYAGYPLCEGLVMASNPLWCKSFADWEQQLGDWINDASWASIRNLLIFIDGRSVYGEHIYVEQLKQLTYQRVHKEHLLKKILSNTMYVKKGISVLGQILVETHGPHAGLLNIKEIAILPYVNAVRLLAFKENMMETSTIARLERLPEKWLSSSSIEIYKQHFLKLINYRLLFGIHPNYETGHYLPLDQMTKEQIRELKEAIQQGATLFHFAKRLIEKGDSFGWE